MERELISITEAGKRWFGVSHTKAKALADDGTIPTVQVGKRRKVDVAEMNARFSRSDERALAELVRKNIRTIEIALLLMTTSPNVEIHTDITPRGIAELANSLRGLCGCAL